MINMERKIEKERVTKIQAFFRIKNRKSIIFKIEKYKCS